MGICKKTFVPIPSHSHFAIPVPMNKNYTFPFPLDSHGIHVTSRIPASCLHQKAVIWNRTNQFNNIFLPWLWTLTYGLDLRKWPLDSAKVN